MTVAIDQQVRKVVVTDLKRTQIVMYAAAGGDFNPLHTDEPFATQIAGNPTVMAHGMLTMGLAVQPVVDWLDNRGVILGYGVRFTRPVVVDPADGATVTVVAKVGALGEDETRIDLTVTFDGATVLGKAQVRVSLT